MGGRAFIECGNLVKIYKIDGQDVIALQGMDLKVARGEILALMGPSGSGKSTLLNLIGGLDEPSAGSVQVQGDNLLKMTRRQRDHYKRVGVGFIWQQPSRNLISYLSARENVELPMMLEGVHAEKRRKRALELLDVVGLADRADFRPNRLSGGQQQRVALAIALANNPSLILADEPTGQIDAHSANAVLDAFQQSTSLYGTTFILVTHDLRIINWVDRVVTISDGRASQVLFPNQKNGELVQDEWTVLDQTGHLQIPKPLVETLDMRERVKVQLEANHITVWPDDNLLPDANQSAVVPEIDAPQPDHILRRKKITTEEEIVVVENLWRVFRVGSEQVRALQDINLHIPKGVLCAVIGPSGSGKTTLLNLIAGLDEPTQGVVRVRGRDLAMLSDDGKIELRRREIGFVHQTVGLLPYLSVDENIQIPLRLLRLERKERLARIDEALGLVGIKKRSHHRPSELSGGEQQRAAIARALVNRPSLILADEPTGQLDSLTGASIIALFREIVDRTGVTVLIVSHDPNVHRAANQVFELQDGRLMNR